MKKKTSLITIVLSILLCTTFASITAASTTTIYVSPSTKTADVGDTFSMNVTVADVTKLTCWEFKLYFNNAVLECTDAVEGPFLKSGGSTFWQKKIDNENGKVHLACTLLGLTSVNGSGVLATVTFKATASGDSILHLADTKLGDEHIPPQEIPHATSDGTVHVESVDGRDVAITDIIFSKTVVCEGYSASFNVTAQNQGDYTETFNVTAYANVTAIQTQPITLASGNSNTIIFTWNTTGCQEYANYTISAYATPVPGETDNTDNTFVDGTIIIVHEGDINADGKVRVDDILAVALAFGTDYGDPEYDPNLDINCDLKIRVDDILAAALNFGWP